MSTSLRIRVAGGSLAGLFAGVLLHRQGHDVRIYERSGSDLSGRGAGLTGGRELFDALRLIGSHSVGQLSVTSTRQVALDHSGKVVADHPSAGSRFSWDVLYRAALSAFPRDRYLPSLHVARIQDGENVARIHFDNGDSEDVDLVIGADGIASVARKAVNPDRFANSYAGYTAWRIFAPETSLPEMLKPYREALVAFTAPGIQSIAYMVPGHDGETTPGARRLNWGWYRPTTVDALDALYTDAQGRHFDYALPPGGLSPAKRATFQTDADAALPPQLAAVAEIDSPPWIQGIYDYMPARLAGRRVALIGDAGALARPHVGAGTSKAAGDAVALSRWIEKAFSLENALAGYEAERLGSARLLVQHSRDIGAQFGLAEPTAGRQMRATSA